MLFKKNPPAAPPSPSPEDADATKSPESQTNSQNASTGHGPGLERAQTAVTENTDYPTGLRLALILVSAFVSMFLVSLDRMIITTAIPQITDDFHSAADIGWYGSAFLLTTCACQLLFGKLYANYSIKAVFLTSVVLFEIGSAICGAAPNSIAFILGRAIAGVGGSGVFTGGITVIVFTLPLHKRPMYQGLFGAVFGIASVVGPLLGGVFTTKVTWRWCFYINLPLGAVAIVVIIFLLRIPHRASTRLSTKEKLAQLDFYGTACIVPGSVCLILAMQWGGSKYPWHDGRMIALLVLAFVLLIGFAVVQTCRPKTATIPPRLFMQRSILSGFFVSFLTGSQMMLFVYYLPIWFQAIKGFSAVQSGIRTLPMLLPMVVASILTGVLVRRIGHYTPFMIVGICITCVGAGLLTTLKIDTRQANWIGYQILYGWGLGCSNQAPNLAAQTILPKRDVPVGTALMYFSQLLGGAIFVSVGQNVLNNQLSHHLSSVPGLNPKMFQDTGATSITDLPPSIKPTVLDGYNESLRRVFLVGLIVTCLGILAALLMEWRSTRQNENKQQEASEESGTAETDGRGRNHVDGGSTQEKMSEKDTS